GHVSGGALEAGAQELHANRPRTARIRIAWRGPESLDGIGLRVQDASTSQVRTVIIPCGCNSERAQK
ncbi:MAG: hypothetical protein EA384_13755, partial [Spirochaetaceae bacterium]